MFDAVEELNSKRKKNRRIYIRMFTLQGWLFMDVLVCCSSHHLNSLRLRGAVPCFEMNLDKTRSCCRTTRHHLTCLGGQLSSLIWPWFVTKLSNMELNCRSEAVLMSRNRMVSHLQCPTPTTPSQRCHLSLRSTDSDYFETSGPATGVTGDFVWFC